MWVREAIVKSPTQLSLVGRFPSWSHLFLHSAERWGWCLEGTEKCPNAEGDCCRSGLQNTPGSKGKEKTHLWWTCSNGEIATSINIGIPIHFCLLLWCVMNTAHQTCSTQQGLCVFREHQWGKCLSKN